MAMSRIGTSRIGALAVVFGCSTALAQGAPPLQPLPPPQQPQPGPPQPQPGAPPAGYAPPPPGYTAPPPGYGQPYPYPYPYGPPQYYQQPPPPPPDEIDAVEGRGPPAGYHLDTRYRKGLVITGPIVLGVPYIFSASAASASTHSGDGWLYVPMIGPFMDLLTRKNDCSDSSGSCNDESGTRSLLMFDGLMQSAGGLLLIIGLANPHHVWVRDYAQNDKPTWSIAPSRVGRSGNGAVIFGEF